MYTSRLKSLYWLVLCILASCASKEPVEKFGFEKPPHFPEPTYTFDNNPITLEGFELGKKIFHDGILSRDGSVSCASCHDQTVAFADPQHRLSIGVDNRVGTRNAPSINNLAFMDSFFWDGGVTHVDFIPLNAIQNPSELDNSSSNIVEAMEADQEYPEFFKSTFGTSEITTPRMLHALSQYMVMMVSAGSKYDDYVLGRSTLSPGELNGLEVFEEKCSSCHSGELFTDQGFHNNGLDHTFSDTGRGIITEKEKDHGKFRVPSLRNVELTKPYMHDGRFKTLEEVLEHYSSGIKDSETLDPILKDGIELSEKEKEDLIAFLQSLTDYQFIANPRFFK